MAHISMMRVESYVDSLCVCYVLCVPRPGFTHGTSRNAPQFGLWDLIKVFGLSLPSRTTRSADIISTPHFKMKGQKLWPYLYLYLRLLPFWRIRSIGIHTYTVLTLDIVNDGQQLAVHRCKKRNPIDRLQHLARLPLELPFSPPHPVLFLYMLCWYILHYIILRSSIFFLEGLFQMFEGEQKLLELGKKIPVSNIKIPFFFSLKDNWVCVNVDCHVLQHI
jgi:hypothetical protein